MRFIFRPKHVLILFWCATRAHNILEFQSAPLSGEFIYNFSFFNWIKIPVVLNASQKNQFLEWFEKYLLQPLWVECSHRGADAWGENIFNIFPRYLEYLAHTLFPVKCSGFYPRLLWKAAHSPTSHSHQTGGSLP